MYELLGICLALAALLTFNAGASLLTGLLWRVLRARAQAWPARTRAQLLFALRVLPGLAAIVCVLALLLPAYLAHEPRHAAERVSPQLGALAVVSAAGLLLAGWRGLAAWLATRRLINNWRQNSAPINLPQATIPAYRLRHSFPVVAVVGTLRPRLFIAEHLFAALSADELAAAIAHEGGHLAARDNLKRALLRGCRDMLTIAPCGRALDRAWAEASEAAADEYAARAGSQTALALAAALVKIARLVPAGARPAMPAGASLIGTDAEGIARRVERLMQLATIGRAAKKASIALPASLWLTFGALLMAALLLAVNPQRLVAVHNLIEVAVAALQ